MRDLDDKMLRDAFATRDKRRVRKDSTVAVDGIDWEIDQGFLSASSPSGAASSTDRPRPGSSTRASASRSTASTRRRTGDNDVHQGARGRRDVDPADPKGPRRRPLRGDRRPRLVLLTGEPGVGKTCVMRAVRARVPAQGCRLIYCHNATLGRSDFYRQLCHALGLSPSATAAALFYAVSTHVQDLGKEHMHPVFLLDEAHLLHQDTLDHLYILLNYEWDSRALLSLVWVGLPELEDRLALRRNRSLF